mmetsp:Transcript_21541/g.52054  ORF Transcript_21541/g.52054 Transcript_21541/m.52054 type:complete len:288 (+) Transcript_21541:69-932(+)
MNKRSQIVLHVVVLLYTRLKIVRMTRDVKCHVALNAHIMRVVDGDGSKVGLVYRAIGYLRDHARARLLVVKVNGITTHYVCHSHPEKLCSSDSPLRLPHDDGMTSQSCEERLGTRHRAPATLVRSAFEGRVIGGVRSVVAPNNYVPREQANLALILPQARMVIMLQGLCQRDLPVILPIDRNALNAGGGDRPALVVVITSRILHVRGGHDDLASIGPIHAILQEDLGVPDGWRTCFRLASGDVRRQSRPGGVVQLAVQIHLGARGISHKDALHAHVGSCRPGEVAIA